jgi:mRNA interferase RelE/StbE
MAGYAIRVKASVERDIAALPRDIVPRILQSIEALSETPLPFGVRRLSGAEHLYRIRVGDYRIVYAVDHAAQEVIILYVRHRRSAYRGL